MADEELAPYPNSTDRVRVAVYSKITGDIKMLVSCSLYDGHRQHGHLPDHDYIDVTGLSFSASDHVVDLKTLKIVPRKTPNVGDLSMKESLLRRSHADSKIPAFDVHEIMLRAALGDEAAKKIASDHVAAIQAADKRLAMLLDQVAKSSTRAELDKIQWESTT